MTRLGRLPAILKNSREALVRADRRSLLVSIGLIGLAAGADAAEPAWMPASPKKPLSDITIGFTDVGAGGNAYSATYIETFIKYAKELGVNAVVLDSQGDPAKQADQIRDL